MGPRPLSICLLLQCGGGGVDFRSVLLAVITVIGECLTTNTCKCLVSNSTNTSSVNPLEVVGRASEIQIRVGENLN